MTTIDDRDLFDDEDLLDFEDPEHRDEVRARYQPGAGQLPSTVRAARILMYVQAAFPLLLPVFAIATRGGGGGAPVPATTTTTIVGAAGTTGRQGGGGGVLLIGLVLFIGLIVLLIVVGSRLGRLTRSARTAALAVEAVVVLASVFLAIRGSIPFGLLLASAVAVIGCLLAPSTTRAINAALTADSSTRFDVRNLPTLDR
jgi:hypothetical protein